MALHGILALISVRNSVLPLIITSFLMGRSILLWEASKWIGGISYLSESKSHLSFDWVTSELCSLLVSAGSPARWCCTKAPLAWASTLWAGKTEKVFLCPSFWPVDQQTWVENSREETRSYPWVFLLNLHSHHSRKENDFQLWLQKHLNYRRKMMRALWLQVHVTV